MEPNPQISRGYIQNLTDFFPDEALRSTETKAIGAIAIVASGLRGGAFYGFPWGDCNPALFNHRSTQALYEFEISM